MSPPPAGSTAEVRIGDVVVPSVDGAALPRPDFTARKTEWEAGLGAALTSAGYPAKVDSVLVNKPMVVAILFLLVLYVTMVCGPIAATERLSGGAPQRGHLQERRGRRHHCRDRLAGKLSGWSRMPAAWIAKLAWRDRLEGAAEALF